MASWLVTARFDAYLGAGRGASTRSERWRRAEEDWWLWLPGYHDSLSSTLAIAAAAGCEQLAVYDSVKRRPSQWEAEVLLGQAGDVEGPVDHWELVECDSTAIAWLLDFWPVELRGLPPLGGRVGERGYLSYPAARAAGHLSQ